MRNAVRSVAPVVMVLASSVVLSGCSFGQLGVRAGSVREASSATISVTPAPTGQAVAPSNPVVVTVAKPSRGAVDAPGKRHRKPPPQESINKRMGEPVGKQMGQKSFKVGKSRGRG